MAEHNPQHGRRPHFNRGRRGQDRRGTERRTPQRDHAPESGPRDSSRDSQRDTQRENGVDVEQIMRDIRSRIAQRHGIELSNQQIQELAARRLEAILEPRNVKPQLLEQLRKSAGSGPEITASAPLDSYAFEETTLYETHRGVLRFFRKLLNPILKLFFNPTPLINALHTQARINKELSARELERERRQTEWNALQYELVQRVVLETSRVSIEMQALSSRIESLSAKVDFNERRVRGMETGSPSQPPRPPQRVHQETPPPSSASAESVTPEGAPAGDGTAEGNRKRRRRRRGRRGGSGTGEQPGAPNAIAPGEEDLDAGEGAEGDEEETIAVATQAEAAIAVIPLPSPAENPVETVTGSTDHSQEPIPEPAAVPTPPHDEPTPDHPVDHADPGPVDR